MTTSVAVKPPCRVQTTAAITLSGEQTVNGVAVVTGDRVLVKDQADNTQNGIYVADTSAWSRSPDFDGSLDAVDGTLVLVHATSGPDQIYELSATNPVVIGTSALTFSLSSLTTSAFGASLIAAADAAAARALLEVAGLTSNSFVGNQTVTGDVIMSGGSVIEAEGAAVVSAATIDIWATDGNTRHITGSTGPITSFGTAPQAGAWMRLIFDDTPTLVQSASLNLNGGGSNIAMEAGDVALVYADTTTQLDVFVIRKSGAAVVGSATVQRSYLAGCIMSTAGSSATMSIAAGMAADSTNVVLMNLTAIAKTTANWSVGTATGGKARAAAIANSTWYHFYVIRRPDTGVVDVCFSLSAAGLVAADYVAGGGNVPDAYTQYRRIGSGKTDGSAQWTKFVQSDRYFRWDVIVPDVNANNPGAAAVTDTLTVPTGVVVYADIRYQVYGVATSPFGLVTALDQTDTTPSVSAFDVQSASSALIGATAMVVKTNTSAQIRSRQSTSAGGDLKRINTVGWYDYAGKDA